MSTPNNPNAINERMLDEYRADVERTSGTALSRAEAWHDFADQLGWEPDDNPYTDEEVSA